MYAHLVNVQHCLWNLPTNYVRSIRKMCQYFANKLRIYVIFHNIRINTFFVELHVYCCYQKRFLAYNILLSYLKVLKILLKYFHIFVQLRKCKSHIVFILLNNKYKLLDDLAIWNTLNVAEYYIFYFTRSRWFFFIFTYHCFNIGYL